MEKEAGEIDMEINEAKPAEFIVIKRKIKVSGAQTQYDNSLQSLTKDEIIEVK